MSKIVEQHIACPICPSSDAYCLYDDGHGHCYSCDYHYRPNKDFELQDFSYEYIPLRGLTKQSLEFYGAKTKVDKEGKPVAIGFKYPNGAYKVRLLGSKDFYTEKAADGSEIGKAGLFGRDKFTAGSHKYVTITEGEIDAITLYQILKSPVVSVQSAVTAQRDCTVERSWLNGYERVYLAFDDDAAGRSACASVAKLFDYNKVYVVKFDKRKDANEYLQHGELDDLRNLWWNSKRYLPDQIKSSFADFERILTEPIKRGVSYPWKTLTDMTYGIRTSESVLITAQEGIGKTELMHAIEHKLLKETDDAIGAIFLEEPKLRHLQALGGVELRRPVHLPDSGVSSGEVLKAIKDLVVVDDRLHIYSHFGSDDPEVILDTIRFLVTARNCKYILFDHVSMAVSGLAGEDERRALDYLSTRLEMMVKELDFGLIFVSHVNDFGQTRGSRYIGKICDLRIDLKRDILHQDLVERNTTYLTVSKNRFSGKTGPAGKLVFDPLTYSYTEELTYAQAANDNGKDTVLEVRSAA